MRNLTNNITNKSLGRCWARTLDGSYRLHSFTFYSQLSSRLTIFGLQKQASCGWRLIYANYYPWYNLAGKSNSTFSSKINRFDGIINRYTDTLHTINKSINARNISERKSNHSQVTVRSHPFMSLRWNSFVHLPIFNAHLSLLSLWPPANLLQLLI